MSFNDAMTESRAQERDRDRDRELIRVDLAHDKLGIAAALRQAFAAAAQDSSTHDFDRLLKELR
jgi:hypothetical protein